MSRKTISKSYQYLPPKIESGRLKVGEHNGIDIYFDRVRRRFQANWRLARPSATLHAQSFDGLTKQLDRMQAKVNMGQPCAVLIEVYQGGRYILIPAKTTGRTKLDGFLPTEGRVEVVVKGVKSWKSSREVFRGSLSLAKRLNQNAMTLEKAERTDQKLRAQLVRFTVPKRLKKLPIKVTQAAKLCSPDMPNQQ